MIDDDLARLRQLVARVAEASGMPRRALERKIGLASGTLGRILDGDLDPSIEQLANLARLLRVPPGELLAAGCPQVTAAARHRLSHWIGPVDTAGPRAPSAAPSPEELVALVRTIVREELAARKGR